MPKNAKIRKSGRAQRKRMFVDSYEQLGRDEERQLLGALRASLQSFESEQRSVVNVVRTTPRRTKPKGQNTPSKPEAPRTSSGAVARQRQTRATVAATPIATSVSTRSGGHRKTSRTASRSKEKPPNDDTILSNKNNTLSNNDNPPSNNDNLPSNCNKKPSNHDSMPSSHESTPGNHDNTFTNTDLTVPAATRRKRTIIRQKSGDSQKKRSGTLTGAGSHRKPPVKRRAMTTPVSVKPTLPLHEDGDPTPRETEEFVEYLCSRKVSTAKAEVKRQEEDDEDGDERDLVIAESDGGGDPKSDTEDLSIFDFDDDTKKGNASGGNSSSNSVSTIPTPTGEKAPSPQKHRKLKKRRITQNYYNAKLKTSDLAENSAIAPVPVFRPTGEEFKNFHAYLEKITPQLLAHGCCKVIPPFKWRLPKQVIQEDIKFASHAQQVHRMCHRAGPSSTVLAQIKAHLIHEHGMEWKGPPLIGNVVVDLTRFSWLMKKHGGLQVVIDRNRWGKIGDALGIPHVAERNVQLEEVYCKYLLSYDLLSDADRRELKIDELDLNEGVEVSGKQMALVALRRHDANTRKTRFPEDGTSSVTVTEQDFWNLLSSAEEYFIAVKGLESTTTHGSGFPAYEPRHVATSDWNLTNLKGLPDGVIGFLPDVPFITQPRLEFGSLFACAGWHAQPHFLPLISYNHFSHPRIWYSVPASDNPLLMSTLQDLVPRLTPGQHILDHTTVLIPPAELINERVTVYRAVQKPGEFVITAPKAYTSYLSTGLNVNESVNFATSEWLHYAAESVGLYQVLKAVPPLNIPHVTLEVFKKLDSLNETSLRQAEPHLTAILQRELDSRRSCTLPVATVVQETPTLHCDTCRTTCHFSRIRPGDRIQAVSDKKSKYKFLRSPVFCFEHGIHVKSGVLEIRVTDVTLEKFLSTLKKRLYPKKSIVHPVQALARSVCRPLKPPTGTTTSPPKAGVLPLPLRQEDKAAGGEPEGRSGPSPVCPPSPAEEASQKSAGPLGLIIPTQPLPHHRHPSPLFTSPIAPASPSTVMSVPLARPIPIKPTGPIPMKPTGLKSPLIPRHMTSAQPAFPIQSASAPALWEYWHPGMSGLNPP